jgi:hypothetical protein
LAERWRSIWTPGRHSLRHWAGPWALIGPDAKLFDIISRLPAGFYQRFLILTGRRKLSR